MKHTLRETIKSLCRSLPVRSFLAGLFLPLTALLLPLTVTDATAQLNTNRLMQVGRNAIYFEDYVLGMQYFNRVINVKPYLAEPYFYRGVAKYYLDDLQGALQDCNIAIQMNPFMIGAYNMAGIVLLRQDKSADALKLFKKGLSYEADNLNLMLNCGVACINLEEFDDALGYCNKVLDYDKQNTQAYLYRGIAHVQRGDSLLAMADFEQAAKINRYSAEAQTYMGMLSYQMGDYARALKHYDRLAELRKKDAGVFVNRAITKYNLDDFDGCFADLDRAIEMDGKNVLAYMNRGMLKNQVGKPDEAAEDYSKVLALEPQNDMALMNRAISYIELGLMQRALDDLNIIIARRPEFPGAYYQRAVVKEALGDREGAQIDQNTAYVFNQERIKRGLQAAADTAAIAAEERADTNKDGGRKRRKLASRDKDDRDMEKYDQMVVVADFGANDDKLHTQPGEQIRGRVQDRDIIIDLEPVYQISFFNADTLLPKPHYYARSVEEFNNRGLGLGRLCLTNREYTAGQDATAEHYTTISLLTAQINQQPENTLLYFARGTLSNTVMSYNEAISDYNVCLVKNPGDANALFNRAATRFKMLELIRSNDSQTSPALPTGTLSIGGTAGSVHSPQQPTLPTVTYMDFDLIMADLQQVVRIDPQMACAYFNMSLVMSMRGNMEEARRYLDEAIAAEPEFAEAYFNRGIIKVYGGDTDGGRQDLSKAGELGIYKAYNVIKRYCDE